MTTTKNHKAAPAEGTAKKHDPIAAGQAFLPGEPIPRLPTTNAPRIRNTGPPMTRPATVNFVQIARQHIDMMVSGGKTLAQIRSHYLWEYYISDKPTTDTEFHKWLYATIVRLVEAMLIGQSDAHGDLIDLDG